LTISV